MPVISYFFGIYIRMYHNDHAPPHFHIEYQGQEGWMRIEDGVLFRGKIPARALRIVQEWTEEHREELYVDWHKARAMLPLDRIPGADQ